MNKISNKKVIMKCWHGWIHTTKSPNLDKETSNSEGYLYKLNHNGNVTYSQSRDFIQIIDTIDPKWNFIIKVKFEKPSFNCCLQGITDVSTITWNSNKFNSLTSSISQFLQQLQLGIHFHVNRIFIPLILPLNDDGISVGNRTANGKLCCPTVSWSKSWLFVKS